MLDTGSQISVCSYSTFIKLGGDPNSLDKSRSFSISSTTELRDDCILGVVKIDLYIMLKMKQGQPEFGKTFVNMLVGKEQLDIENKVILGVDVLHRAKIMIHSNGHQFALVARLEKENGHVARVRLQPHLWEKDIELKSDALDSNANGMILNGSSKLLFTSEATVRNKNLVNKNVVLQPMYSITWENNWTILINSNLLRVKISYRGYYAHRMI